MRVADQFGCFLLQLQRRRLQEVYKLSETFKVKTGRISLLLLIQDTVNVLTSFSVCLYHLIFVCIILMN